MAYCIAQRTLLNVLWQPGWKEHLGECVAEFLCCPPETITTLLIGYTLI